jgi:hypothetical protein
MQTKKWSFPVLKAARWATDSEDTDDNARFEDWVLWVKAGDLPKDLPLDPNARHPDLENKTAKAIARTLREAPEEFVKRNNGICMVARSCIVRDNVATLHLNVIGDDEEEEGRRGDGILNGGHTYCVMRAVVEAGVITDDDDVDAEVDPGTAVVRVEVQTGLVEDVLADISRARNLSTPVQEYSLKNLGMAWEDIKRVLPKSLRENIAFMENDPEAPKAEHDVGDVVKLLALFNNKMYPIEKERHPTAAFTSEKTLVTKWQRDDFQDLLPHLGEFLSLHDETHRLFQEAFAKPGKVDGVEKVEGNDVTLLGGTKPKYRFPNGLVFPVLAALRVFFDNNNGKWRVAPADLMKKGGIAEVLVADAVKQYREMGKSNAAFYGRNKQVWAMLGMRAQLLRAQGTA